MNTISLPRWGAFAKCFVNYVKTYSYFQFLSRFRSYRYVFKLQRFVSSRLESDIADLLRFWVGFYGVIRHLVTDRFHNFVQVCL